MIHPLLPRWARASSAIPVLLCAWLCLACPPQLQRSQPAEPPPSTDVAAQPEAPAKLPRTVDGSSAEVVLLMTNPVPARVRDLMALVRDRIFYLSGLRVLGIYPASASARFAETRAMLKAQGVGWIELRGLNCEIEDDKVFAANSCGDTFKALFEGSAGLWLNGGPDIPPRHYGEETLLTTRIKDPPRHAMELSLLHHLLGRSEQGSAALVEGRPDYFVIGICLGMQSLSVALGGTMHQDVPSELYKARTVEDVLELPEAQRHRNYQIALHPIARKDYWALHPIKVEPGWPFAPVDPAAAPSYRVVSAHHQAVEKLGADLEVLARSEDGKVIEAVRHKRYRNVFGVQFHPEYEMIYDVDPGATANGATSSEGKPNDPAMRVFHVRLWQVLAERLAASAR